MAPYAAARHWHSARFHSRLVASGAGGRLAFDPPPTEAAGSSRNSANPRPPPRSSAKCAMTTAGKRSSVRATERRPSAPYPPSSSPDDRLDACVGRGAHTPRPGFGVATRAPPAAKRLAARASSRASAGGGGGDAGSTCAPSRATWLAAAASGRSIWLELFLSSAMSLAFPTPIAAPTTHVSVTGGLFPAVSVSVTTCAVRVELPPPNSVVSVARLHSLSSMMLRGVGFSAPELDDRRGGGEVRRTSTRTSSPARTSSPSPPPPSAVGPVGVSPVSSGVSRRQTARMSVSDDAKRRILCASAAKVASTSRIDSASFADATGASAFGLDA